MNKLNPRDSQTIFGSVALMQEFNPSLPLAATNHLTALAGGWEHSITGSDLRKAISDFGETHQKLIFQGRDAAGQIADQCFSSLVCVYIDATGDVDVYKNLPKGQPVADVMEMSVA